MTKIPVLHEIRFHKDGTQTDTYSVDGAVIKESRGPLTVVFVRQNLILEEPQLNELMATKDPQ